MQQISLVGILQKVLQIRHGLLNTIVYFAKRGRENQREMKPGALQLNNNNKPAEVLHLKQESDENQSTFKCSRFYTFCVSRL